MFTHITKNSIRAVLYTLLFTITLKTLSTHTEATFSPIQQTDTKNIDVTKELSFYDTLIHLVFAPPRILYAAPPSSPYTPGETLDPTCSPGDSNCSVDFTTVPTGTEGQVVSYDSSGNPIATTTLPSLTLEGFTVTGTGTTTFANGISLTDGCIEINGTCLSSGSSLPSGTTGQTIIYDASNNQTATSTLTIGTDGVTTIAGRVEQTGLGFSTFFGEGAGESDDGTNNYNTGVGYQALFANAVGVQNTAFGYGALKNNQTGHYNVAVGFDTLFNNDSGLGNVAIGASALEAQTSGNYNIAIGQSALQSSNGTTGNVVVGFAAANVMKTGYYNAAFGDGALFYNYTGNENVAIGARALRNNSSATSTTAIGSYSGYGVNGSTYSQNNVFLGYRSGYANTTGDNNTLLGYQSGDNLTSGDNNIIIGYDIDAQSATGSNQLSIGNLIFSNGIDGTGTSLSSGNIGIGTTTPNSKLSVSGDSYTSGTSTTNALTITGQGTGIQFADGTIQTTAASGGSSVADIFAISGGIVSNTGGDSTTATDDFVFGDSDLEGDGSKFLFDESHVNPTVPPNEPALLY